MSQSQMTAKQAAIDLIKNYVDRGDDMEHFRHGMLGSWNDEYSAQIGGYNNGKKYPTTKIVVYRLNGKEIDEVFDYWEIVNEIKNKQVQYTLF